MKTLGANNIIVMVLVTALVVVTFLLMHTLFSRPISGLAVELLAAAVAVVLVVVSVGITIHFQNKAETERQYRVCLFENKMREYTKFLELTAKADDDDRVDDNEVEQIRNQARVIAMLAHKPMLISLAAFVDNLEQTRELHIGDSSGNGTFQEVIVAMRVDLSVVDIVTQESERAIRQMVLRPRKSSDARRTR